MATLGKSIYTRVPLPSQEERLPVQATDVFIYIPSLSFFCSSTFVQEVPGIGW